MLHVVQQMQYGCHCSQSVLHSLTNEDIVTRTKYSKRILDSCPNQVQLSLCCPLQARILPILASIISHANSNSSILVEGALDVLVSLVKAASPEQVQQMHSIVGPHIQTLMLQHQDAGILQSCCQYIK